ncbi:MAG: ferritin-like domain-containing protein [Deltaproteobacteria bacterium]|nr:ferritin-like domain-containing protein [Deltaproteobacteria bacterium]
MTLAEVNREPFIDKLCERQVLEEAITELYERAIRHARSEQDFGQLVEKLVAFQQQERAHVDMLEQAIRALGGDPAQMTPSIRVMRAEIAGLAAVCESADIALPHVLSALFAGELIDHAGWELLCDLAREVELSEEWLRRFEDALREERVHLAWVRDQLSKATREEVMATPVPPTA